MKLSNEKSEKCLNLISLIAEFIIKINETDDWNSCPRSGKLLTLGIREKWKVAREKRLENVYVHDVFERSKNLKISE